MTRSITPHSRPCRQEWSGIFTVLLLLAIACLGPVLNWNCRLDGCEPEPAAKSAESRAIEFLCREVPRWSVENRCYSCHNNGDGARALFEAARCGLAVSHPSVANTLEWLQSPHRWEHNSGEGPFSDKKLARLQFAASLCGAVEAKLICDRRPLIEAARLVAADQEPDGSWQIEPAETIGSPVTYGRPLATFIARDTLHAADARCFCESIVKADSWLADFPVRSVLDAAVAVRAGVRGSDPAMKRRVDQALDLLRRAQSVEGGWGPYVTAPPESFDTAVVLFALAGCSNRQGVSDIIGRGRSFLLAAQLPDGSWPETTRPAGAESYAQRLSTSGWATIALLATRSPERPRRQH